MFEHSLRKHANLLGIYVIAPNKYHTLTYTKQRLANHLHQKTISEYIANPVEIILYVATDLRRSIKII